MARVQGLITGRDGLVRGAVLKVASKSGTPTILQHPLQLLYPLEVSSETPTTNGTELESKGGASDEQMSSPDAPTRESEQTHSRPTREAAVSGRRLIRQWCTAENVLTTIQ